MSRGCRGPGPVTASLVSGTMEAMAVEPTLLLSDAERDAVVMRLRDGFSEGRLDVEDFYRRLDAAYAARTHGEIVALTKDLPSVRDRTRFAPLARRRRKVPRFRNYLSVNAVLWGIWGAQELTGQSSHDLWPVWITIPWGTWLLFRSLH